ncbi:hypothetical protein [Paraburkholderia sp.]|uniref:hypothetical protein n=1 Tax=Paraburkholderia sp. TaxID=1926495 RepID=UPI003D6DC6BB
MTPIKFVLSYTAVPLTAIVGVVIWMSIPSSTEIDARQYVALSSAYASFPPALRHDIASALKTGRLSSWDYQALVRESLADGVALDWPSSGTGSVAVEREKLTTLVQADIRPLEHH